MTNLAHWSSVKDLSRESSNHTCLLQMQARATKDYLRDNSYQIRGQLMTHYSLRHMFKSCSSSNKIVLTIFLLHSTNSSNPSSNLHKFMTTSYSKRAISKQSQLWGSTSHKWPHHRKTSTQPTREDGHRRVISNFKPHSSTTRQHATIEMSHKCDSITAKVHKRLLDLVKLIWAQLVHQHRKQVTLAQQLPLITKTCKTTSSVYKKRSDTCNSNLDAMMTKMKNHRQRMLYWSPKFKMSRQWAQWIIRNIVKV